MVHQIDLSWVPHLADTECLEADHWAVTRARARPRPITLRDQADRLLRTRAGGCQNTVVMPGAGSGILKTWKPARAQTAACAPPWTCTT